jgi:hypothetical protein
MDKVMKYLREERKLDEGVAKVIHSHLACHPEIFKEFENYTQTGSFKMADGSCLEIEGYTAEGIDKETNLTAIGAYTYLVYLKEFPEKAKADLATLPRK